MLDAVPVLAVGRADGGVRLLNAISGRVVASFRPLDAPGGFRYTGPTNVALGDLNRDGVADLFVAAASPAGVDGLVAAKARRVFVYDGAALATGAVPPPFRVFTPFRTHQGPGPNGTVDRTGAYTNGLNIAVGDVNGDGTVDLIAGTRGGTAAGGWVEYGRLVVIDGSGPALARVGGAAVAAPGGVTASPFGGTYARGVAVAAGDLDGDGDDEIAVTRDGAVAPTNPNQPPVVKVLIGVTVLGVLSALVALGVTEFRQPIEIPDAEGDGLARQGGVAAAEQTAPFRPFAGVTNAAGDVLTGNARVAFVDHDGDGTDALVFSVVDDVTDPFDAQVRITAFSLDTATGVATAVSTGGGPRYSYLVGEGVVSHATAGVDLGGRGADKLALFTGGASPAIRFLDLATGAALPGGVAVSVAAGGVSLDGI